MIDFNYVREVIKEGDFKDIGTIPVKEFVTESWISDEQDKLWRRNLRLNKDRIQPTPYFSEYKDKPVILVGSSPAILKNYEALKQCGKDFTIIACNRIARFLVKNGIKPDFVFNVEARNHILQDFGFSHKGITLITSPFVCPEVIKGWKGRHYTYMVGGGKYYKDIITDLFPTTLLDISGGNVISTAYCWAYKYLHARNFIVCGMELCYGKNYYYDGIPKVDEDITKHHGYNAVDIQGNVVPTTPALTMYKAWLEAYTKYAIEFGGGSFINSTEAGILGVLREIVNVEGDNIKYALKYIPWISILPLSVAIGGHQKHMEALNGTQK
jgi:hypothetical protein